MLNKLKRKINLFYPVYHYQKSYSQEGEDILLSRIMGKSRKGYYIDIGAHHPTRFSNTYYFYKLGWRGINIDAMPGSMVLFNKIRKQDTNLEFAINNCEKIMVYYMFNEPALNTFDENLAKRHETSECYNILKKIEIRTRKLSTVLDHYLNQNRSIDFMNIDVEGLDFNVLQSNNWNKYRPNFILIENHDLLNLNNIGQSRIVSFLLKKDYLLHSKLHLSLLFRNISKTEGI